jgi:hypothetical protein
MVNLGLPEALAVKISLVPFPVLTMAVALPPAMPETWRRPAGAFVPIPSLLLLESKKRLVLSWERTPDVPAKRMEPEAGAYQVGVPAPPEIRA